MYFIYADESGDSGRGVGGTPFFVISGLIIHESYWNETFGRFLELRRNLARRYHIPQRIALHATDIVNGNKDFHHSRYGLSTDDRFNLYRDVLEFLAQITEIHVLNVFIRKDHIPADWEGKVFDWAWTLFIQRFHNTINTGGVLGNDNDYGLLITDRTQDDRLRHIMRLMRAFNHVPNLGQPGSRRILVTRLLDDPVPRNSQHSYWVQMADMIAYSLARRDYQRGRLKPHAFETYFDILDPVLLKEASRYDDQGIVYWPRP
jgi:hypothetical protein